jgi:serine-type D-Ala-D-Ala carboxypeptidase (penicillin-binding protein 5/6)
MDGQLGGHIGGVVGVWIGGSIKEVKVKNICLVIFLIAWFPISPVSPASAKSIKRIPAKAAIVTDSSGTVIFGKFPNARLAPASTLKLVTAMVAIDNLYPWTKVTISKNAAKVHSIKPRLQPDEEMTVSDLLHIVLMKSVNSAAVALAEATVGSEHDFVVLMNLKAREIGAKNTLFSNASGLPSKEQQYTTARDLTLILKEALSYPLIRSILGKKEYLVRTAAGREIYLENSDYLLWQSDNVIGGKTGYTGTARNCFVCALDTDKGPIYTAVLGARSRSSLWSSTIMLEEIGLTTDGISLPLNLLNLALTLSGDYN